MFGEETVMTHRNTFLKIAVSLLALSLGVWMGWAIGSMWFALLTATTALGLAVVLGKSSAEPSPAVVLPFAVAVGAALGGLAVLFHASLSGLLLQVIFTMLTVTAVTAVVYGCPLRKVVQPRSRLAKTIILGVLGFGVLIALNAVIIYTGTLIGLAFCAIPAFLVASSLACEYENVETSIQARYSECYGWGAGGLIVLVLGGGWLGPVLSLPRIVGFWIYGVWRRMNRS